MEIKALCQTLSKAFDVSKARAKVSSKSLKVSSNFWMKKGNKRIWDIYQTTVAFNTILMVIECGPNKLTASLLYGMKLSNIVTVIYTIDVYTVIIDKYRWLYEMLSHCLVRFAQNPTLWQLLYNDSGTRWFLWLPLQIIFRRVLICESW